MYRLGLGVSKDYVEAVKWFRKAAEQGYARAQYSLGVSYANATGILWPGVHYIVVADVGDGRYVTFQSTEVAVPGSLFQKILSLIDDLRRRPVPA